MRSCFGYLLIATSLLFSTGGVALNSAAQTRALVEGASPSNPIPTATDEVHGPSAEALAVVRASADDASGSCRAPVPHVRKIKAHAADGPNELNSRGYNYSRPGEMHAPVPAAPAEAD